MWVQRVCMCDDSTHHFTADPLLIVRFSYDLIHQKEIVRKTPSSRSIHRGENNRLVPHKYYLKCSLHTVKSQAGRHQSLKPIKGKYALSYGQAMFSVFCQ